MTTAEEIIRLHGDLTGTRRLDTEYAWYRKLITASDTVIQRVLHLCQYDTSPVSMNLLGLCYRFVIRSPDNAVEWFRRSAEMGNSEGMNHLATSYVHGEGVARDQAEALKWLQKSASLGNSNAMSEIGFHYHNLGTAEGRITALEWFRKSAGLDNPFAMFFLGTCHEETGDEEALAWYSKSADLGHPDAMIKLAKRAEKDGDESVALRWYERSNEVSIYPNERRHHLDDFLRRMGPLPGVSGVRYYYDTYLSGSHDEQQSRLRQLGSFIGGDISIFLLGRWLESEERNRKQMEEIELLKVQVEALRTEVDFRPGGSGFDRAKADFEALQR